MFNFLKRKMPDSTIAKVHGAMKNIRLGKTSKQGGGFQTGWDKNKRRLTVVLYSPPIYGWLRSRSRMLAAEFTLGAILQNVPAGQIEAYAKTRRALERKGKGAGQKQ